LQVVITLTVKNVRQASP